MLFTPLAISRKNNDNMLLCQVLLPMMAHSFDSKGQIFSYEQGVSESMKMWCEARLKTTLLQNRYRCPRSVVSFCFVLYEKYAIWISETHLDGVKARYHVYS